MTARIVLVCLAPEGRYFQKNSQAREVARAVVIRDTRGMKPMRGRTWTKVGV